MDVGISRRSRVSPTASMIKNHGGTNRLRTSTDASEASVCHPVDDNLAYLLTEGVEVEEEFLKTRHY